MAPFLNDAVTFALPFFLAITLTDFFLTAESFATEVLLDFHVTFFLKFFTVIVFFCPTVIERFFLLSLGAFLAAEAVSTENEGAAAETVKSIAIAAQNFLEFFIP